MTINILESKFPTKLVTEGQLLLEPTNDMHIIEEFEARLDRLGEDYALVECCKVTKRKSVFLGWSIAVPKDRI